jgi:hypothetical protein
MRLLGAGDYTPRQCAADESLALTQIGRTGSTHGRDSASRRPVKY